MDIETFNGTIEAIKLGKYEEAYATIRKGCKTKPNELAYRIGRVVGALTDPDGFHKEPDRAATFLEMFKPKFTWIAINPRPSFLPENRE